MKNYKKNFFDNNALDYSKKYSSRNYFHNYFFLSRYNLIYSFVKNIKCNTILDIGSGSGNFYKLFKIDKLNFDKYIATDISSKMFNISPVPNDSKFIGEIKNIKLNYTFDLILMIGVSTYIEKKSLFADIEHIDKLLNKNGYFIITLNNNLSFDLFLRRFFKFFFKYLIPKSIKDKSILFGIKKINLHKDYEISNILKNKSINIEKIFYHNFTFFPFNLLFPRFSIFIANFLQKFNKIPFLYSDKIIIFRKS